MPIIVQGQFKDTGQIHFINKEHTDDSLRRTRVEDSATRFSCKSEAKLYLDDLAIENTRFNECTYSYIEIETNSSAAYSYGEDVSKFKAHDNIFYLSDGDRKRLGGYPIIIYKNGKKTKNDRFMMRYV